MTDPQTKGVAVDMDEHPSAQPQSTEEVTLEKILERVGGKRMSPEEFEKHFGELPTDGEG